MKDMENQEVLFEIDHLEKQFKVSGGTLKAVDDVSFQIKKGETFGLVGESGCGKSTLGRLLVRLYEPTGGDIRFQGKSIRGLGRKEAKDYTFNVQMIFQESYASLNPRMTIGDIIKEGMRIHHMGSAQEMDDRMYELLDLVGLNQEHAQRFPYEFSGGQRQRAGIARALAVNPQFLVCDEPISALDVSIQAQIINLLKRLQKELNLTYLFIAHDLSAVRYVSDRVGVMYLGSLMEVADAEELYLNPLHPYTQALISAIPKPDPDEENSRTRIVLEGDVPSPIDVPKGCKFAGRCPHATEACRQETPKLRTLGKNHQVACLRAEEFFHFE
jgi:oligopeptide transport system ATP-binding protein